MKHNISTKGVVGFVTTVVVLGLLLLVATCTKRKAGLDPYSVADHPWKNSTFNNVCFAHDIKDLDGIPCVYKHIVKPGAVIVFDDKFDLQQPQVAAEGLYHWVGDWPGTPHPDYYSDHWTVEPPPATARWSECVAPDTVLGRSGNEVWPGAVIYAKNLRGVKLSIEANNAPAEILHAVGCTKSTFTVRGFGAGRVRMNANIGAARSTGSGGNTWKLSLDGCYGPAFRADTSTDYETVTGRAQGVKVIEDTGVCHLGGTDTGQGLVKFSNLTVIGSLREAPIAKLWVAGIFADNGAVNIRLDDVRFYDLDAGFIANEGKGHTLLDLAFTNVKWQTVWLNTDPALSTFSLSYEAWLDPLEDVRWIPVDN